MKKERKEIHEMVLRGGELFLSNISVDNVIFGYQDNLLQVLLLEVTEGKWMLPGGFIFKEESIDAAAARILQERTGLGGFYLKQFYTFGDPRRSITNEIEKLFEQLELPWDPDLWINQRFASVGYYALVEMANAHPTAGMFSQQFGWFSVEALPKLLLDHEEIIDTALKQFRSDLQVYPHAFHLLPAKFTMPELHRLFETIYAKKMDRSRFQKKMLGYEVFERLEERRDGVPHKRPFLYKHIGGEKRG